MLQGNKLEEKVNHACCGRGGGGRDVNMCLRFFQRWLEVLTISYIR